MEIEPYVPENYARYENLDDGSPISIIKSFDDMNYTCDVSIAQMEKELENPVYRDVKLLFEMERSIRMDFKILTLDHILFCQKVKNVETIGDLIFGVEANAGYFNIKIGDKIIVEKYCETPQLVKFDVIPKFLIHYHLITINGDVDNVLVARILPIDTMQKSLMIHYEKPYSQFVEYKTDSNADTETMS